MLYFCVLEIKFESLNEMGAIYMRKLMTTVAIAATLLSTSTSEAGYQSTYSQTAVQTEQVVEAPVAEAQPIVPVEVSAAEAQPVAAAESQPTVPVEAPAVAEQPADIKAGDTEHSEAVDNAVMSKESLSEGIANVTAVGYAEIGNNVAAMDDAQRNAVEKALSNFMPVDNKPDSVYQTVCDKYASFITEFNIVDIQEESGMTKLQAKVTVDMKAIKTAVEEASKPAQPVIPVEVEPVSNEAGAVPSINVLVRTVGTNNTALVADIASIFDANFQSSSFDTAVSDVVKDKVDDYSSLAYDDYCMLLKQYAEQGGKYTNFAILGEIATDAVLTDESGITQRATVRIKLYDLIYNRQLGELTEDYFAKGATAEEAEKAAISKAATEAAAVLSDEAVKYWTVNKDSITNNIERRKKGVTSEVFY